MILRLIFYQYACGRFKSQYLDVEYYLNIFLQMDQQGRSPALIEADLWFCLHRNCPNPIMGPFDPRKVMKDHSDHKDIENFTSFNDAHKKFLEMV
jgi:hypothetical protein